MRIDFKYNQQGYFILDRELDLPNNCYNFYYGSKLTRVNLRCISTYEYFTNNGWWEILGYIEIESLDKFSVLEVDRWEIKVGQSDAGRYISSQEIINTILIMIRRDIKIDLILNEV